MFYFISVALPRHTRSPFVYIPKTTQYMQAREKCVDEKNWHSTTQLPRVGINNIQISTWNKSLSKYSNYYVITFHPIRSLLPINKFLVKNKRKEKKTSHRFDKKPAWENLIGGKKEEEKKYEVMEGRK